MQNLKAKVDGHNKKNTQKDIIFKNKNMPLLEKKNLSNERSMPH